MDSVTNNLRPLSVLAQSYPQHKPRILQYCQERGVTPFLHGFNMRPKRYTRLFELKLGERDAETWGQPFDSPEAKKSQPISVGTLADVPEEIDNYFFKAPKRLWVELQLLPESAKILYWEEVEWDERTRSACNWQKWNNIGVCLVAPTFQINCLNYQPIWLSAINYLELENWLLKNPPAQVRRRNKLEPTELEELIQRAYRSQLAKDNTRWNVVLSELRKHIQPQDQLVIPRTLSDPSLKIELQVAGIDSPQVMAISTFKRILSEYRKGSRKITVTQ